MGVGLVLFFFMCVGYGCFEVFGVCEIGVVKIKGVFGLVILSGGRIVGSGLECLGCVYCIVWVVLLECCLLLMVWVFWNSCIV